MEASQGPNQPSSSLSLREAAILAGLSSLTFLILMIPNFNRAYGSGARKPRLDLRTVWKEFKNFG